MISYVIPTRDRPEQLALTLGALAKLDHGVPAEVVIVDNASRFPPTPPRRLANGVPVLMLFNSENEGAAARNRGAARAQHEWVVMLDDDSAPVDARFIEALREAPADVACVAAEIVLPDDRHEAGGLPEVPIGCGMAVRRETFLALGGYDPAFGYYAEEYDLAARILLAGLRTAYDRRFRVLHRKVADGRDFNLILERLVRNNAWVEQRYAPETVREPAIAAMLTRYREIADKEDAMPGFVRGVSQVRATLARQVRSPLAPALYDRFTGRAHAESRLAPALRSMRIRRAALVGEGKHATIVRETVLAAGVQLVELNARPEALVAGTMSPGPMLDAHADWSTKSSLPILTPWEFGRTSRGEVAQRS